MKAWGIMEMTHSAQIETRTMGVAGGAHLLRLAVFLGMVFSLAGCGNSNLLEPIGIGSDRDSLKRSPCACYELPQRGPYWKAS